MDYKCLSECSKYRNTTVFDSIDLPQHGIDMVMIIGRLPGTVGLNLLSVSHVLTSGTQQMMRV